MDIKKELIEETVSTLRNTDATQEERRTLSNKLAEYLFVENSAVRKISDSLLLNYIEVNSSDYDDDDMEVVKMLELSFSFHGKHCTAYISPEKLNDENYGSFACIETTTSDNLMDSFNEVVEDDHWGEIREECVKFLNAGEYRSKCKEHKDR